MLGVVIIAYAILNMNKNNSYKRCDDVKFLKTISDYKIIGLDNNLIHVMLHDSIVTYNLCDGEVVRNMSWR